MKSSDLKSANYPSYFIPYIEVLGEVELMECLQKQLGNFPQFISSLPEGKLHYKYAEGKWTVMQILVHILDAERVFQYRALRFGRNDDTALPGFDQDIYVPESMAEKRTKEDVIEEYKAIRAATISLFKNFDDTILNRAGMASNLRMSVGALGFVCCGHQKHHRNIIRERYLQ